MRTSPHRALRAPMFLLAVLAACCVMPVAAHATSGKVIGGTKVGPDAFTSTWSAVVSVQFAGSGSPSDNHMCGGTLIAPRVVMTARHCVESGPYSIDAAKLRVNGASPRLASTRRVAVAAVHRSPVVPDLVFQRGADIALLILRQEIPGASVAPIATVDHAAWWGAGAGRATGVRVAGWGIARDADVRRERTFGSSQEDLRWAELPVWSASRCARRVPTDRSVARHICAGTQEQRATSTLEGRSSCYGDSGGPLLASDPAGLEPPRVVGIVSRGTADECSAGPGLYTTVAAHEAWIRGILERTATGVELRSVGPDVAPISSDSRGRVRFSLVRPGEAGDTFIAQVRGSGWSAWQEIGRFTDASAVLTVPPTRVGSIRMRIRYADAAGVEGAAGEAWIVPTPVDRAAPRRVAKMRAVRRGWRHLLRWTPTRDVGDRIDGYLIQQRAGSRGRWTWEADIPCSPCRNERWLRTTHVLLPGRRQFRIAAYDRAGNLGPWTTSNVTTGRR